MKSFLVKRIGFNLSPYDLDCFEPSKNQTIIKNGHFITKNGLVLDIQETKSYKLSRKKNRYRIFLDDRNVIELNWFQYIKFSWIQKSTWFQQRSRVEYAIMAIIAIVGIWIAIKF